MLAASAITCHLGVKKRQKLAVHAGQTSALLEPIPLLGGQVDDVGP